MRDYRVCGEVKMIMTTDRIGQAVIQLIHAQS
jgi:hypothetical protein